MLHRQHRTACQGRHLWTQIENTPITQTINSNFYDMPCLVFIASRTAPLSFMYVCDRRTTNSIMMMIMIMIESRYRVIIIIALLRSLENAPLRRRTACIVRDFSDQNDSRQSIDQASGVRQLRDAPLTGVGRPSICVSRFPLSVGTSVKLHLKHKRTNEETDRDMTPSNLVHFSLVSFKCGI